MSKRLPNSRSPNECGLSNHFRKTTKKNSSIEDSWHNNYDRDRESYDLSDDEFTGIEYSQVLNQQPRLRQPQPHPPPNGQRLFTAMSDPGVCAYPQPIPYTLEPVSLPAPMYQYYPPVVRINYAKPYRPRPRTSLRHMQNGPPNCSDTAGNGYSSLQENGWSHSPQMSYQNGDYASLPPTANLENTDNHGELSSEHRRYSDPGLGPADTTNSKNEDTDTDSSFTTIGRNSKILMTFMDQMTRIKDTNSQLFRELHQAKSEIETIKTDFHNFKQNVPGDYKPGMLTDIIKELRDASKIKEDAMIAKVMRMVESQPSRRFMEVEDLKGQLEKVTRENFKSVERIDKLEKEVAELRLRLNSENHREITAFEEENLALRRELQEARASRNHGTKLEKLMGVLPEKSEVTTGGIKSTIEIPAPVISSSTSSSDGSGENEIFTSNDSSKSNSPTNSSINSLATGPVTDL